MKRIIYILLIGVILSNCTTHEEPSYLVQRQFKNSSTHSFELLFIGLHNDTLINQILKPQSSTEIIQRWFDYNFGYGGGFGDFGTKFKLRFIETNKGYVCERDSISPKCISTKSSPFERDFLQKDFTFTNGTYIYVITDKEFEHAHELE